MPKPPSNKMKSTRTDAAASSKTGIIGAAADSIAAAESERISTERIVGAPVKGLPVRAAGQEDRTFAAVLQTRSTDRIVPEGVSRLEAGRRLFVAEAERATTGELALLEEEQKRLREEGDKDEAKLARLRGYIAAANADLAATRFVRGQIEKGVQPKPGEWTVIGRVLTRDGKTVPKAEVVFVDVQGEIVSALAPAAVGDNGAVSEAFSRDVVTKLAQTGARVSAAVRVARRILATDKPPVRVLPDQVYQFDLRVDAVT